MAPSARSVNRGRFDTGSRQVRCEVSAVAGSAGRAMCILLHYLHFVTTIRTPDLSGRAMMTSSYPCALPSPPRVGCCTTGREGVPCRKGDQEVVPAVPASRPGKTPGEDATIEVAAKLALHILRDRSVVIVALAAVGEPGLDVFLDPAIKHTLIWAPPCQSHSWKMRKTA